MCQLGHIYWYGRKAHAMPHTMTTIFSPLVITKQLWAMAIFSVTQQYKLLGSGNSILENGMVGMVVVECCYPFQYSFPWIFKIRIHTSRLCRWWTVIYKLVMYDTLPVCYSVYGHEMMILHFLHTIDVHPRWSRLVLIIPLVFVCCCPAKWYWLGTPALNT